MNCMLFIWELKTLLANFYYSYKSMCVQDMHSMASNTKSPFLSENLYCFFSWWYFLLIKSKYKRHAFQHAFPIKRPYSNSWIRFKWHKITHHNLNFQLKLSNTHQVLNGDIHSLCVCVCNVHACIYVVILV